MNYTTTPLCPTCSASHGAGWCISSGPPPGAACCGPTLRLRRCPWSRTRLGAPSQPGCAAAGRPAAAPASCRGSKRRGSPDALAGSWCFVFFLHSEVSSAVNKRSRRREMEQSDAVMRVWRFTTPACRDTVDRLEGYSVYFTAQLSLSTSLSLYL